MDRAYTVLEIKGIDEEKRVIKGMATTPTPDRIGDIVEPMGAKFSLPMPLLWQHDHGDPVGEVTFAKPTKKGIPFEAKLVKPKADDPESFRERMDTAWSYVKRKLVKAVSIGFRGIEHSIMEGGGWHFHEWEWVELSLVTLPMNSEATISSIKSFDRELRGASANSGSPRSTTSRVRDPLKTVKLKENDDMTKKTLQEQIDALKATREAKAAELHALTSKAAEEGRTMNEEEIASFDEIEAEIDSIDANLTRFERSATISAAKSAKPISGKSAADSDFDRDPNPARTVRTNRVETPKGLNFARAMICLAEAQGQKHVAAQLAKEHYGHDERIENFLKLTPEQKAAVPAAYTGDSGGWAETIAEAQNIGSEFIELLRPQTVVDRLPGLRRVPFNVKVSRMTTGQSGYWVGEAKPTPLTSGVFDNVTLGKTKVGSIAVMSQEQLRFSNINAEMAVRDDLVKALVAALDTKFMSTDAASAGVSPAGILNGVTGKAATGSGDADDVRTDLVNLFETFSAANMSMSSLAYVTTENLHYALGVMRSSLGVSEFPGVMGEPGSLQGRPIISSNHVPGGNVVAISTPNILLADDGDVDVDISREASLEMLDGSLTQDATAGTGASLVNLWQSGLVGIKVERFINWIPGRASSVERITGAVYQGAATS